MLSGYFHRVAHETPTRLWINNPTGEETEWAIAAGAINCTTNPAYCGRLIAAEPAYVRGLIDEAVRETADDDVAAERVYQRAAARLIDRFRPLYEASGGRHGFVTVQGDPRRDDDADFIVAEALRHRRLGPNCMAKIPVVPAGLAAIESLVAQDVPMCATEVFAVEQAIQVCELYQHASRASGRRPPFFVTHITGIFDEYLAGYVARQPAGFGLAPEVLAQAGCAIAREEYRILKARGYPGTLLGGGARGNQHFTEMVGGDVHVTINWSTAESLLALDLPATPRLETPAPAAVVAELAEKLPDFRRAYYAGGLTPAEFKEFGPLQLFRNNFLAGYGRLLAEVAARRRA